MSRVYDVLDMSVVRGVKTVGGVGMCLARSKVGRECERIGFEL